MTRPFLKEMKKSAALVRSGNVIEATKIIQSALRSAVADSDLTTELGPPLRLHSKIQEQPSSLRQTVGVKRPRRPLGENITLLRQGRQLPAPQTTLPHVPLPPGASFGITTFHSAGGSRNYRLYVPSAPSEKPRPLVVMLHGCTQDPADFAAGTGMNALAEELNFLVVYPQQDRRHNQLQCWNWFEPKHQSRTGGEPTIIAGIVDELSNRPDVDGSRIFVIGLSAGAAMAAIMGETYPEIFSGIGIHSGLPYRSASDVASAFAVMKKGAPPCRHEKSPDRSGTTTGPRRIIIFHGDADKTVHPSNGASLFVNAFEADRAEISTRQAQVPGGHAYSVTKAVEESVVAEYWAIHGGGHAWSGGRIFGSYTDPRGPDASREMIKFLFRTND